MKKEALLGLLVLSILSLVGCVKIADVEINGVLTEIPENTSFRNENPIEVTEPPTLEVISTTKETEITETVHARAPVGKKIVIKLIGVNAGEDKCGISVNGVTGWIDEGKSARINGVKIWVFDAFNLHSATYGSVCEVYIGGKTFPLIIE